MRIVLPPSETKQPGGEPGSSLDWARLVMPELTAVRQLIAKDLIEVPSVESSGLKALGLGAKGGEWLEANKELHSSLVMPALTRYTGVLFDALDYSSLDQSARSRADATVWLFSALFGPLRATDNIPRYRLSFDSKLPGESLKSRWQPHQEEIWRGEFTIDLRSEGYRALAPLPEGSGVYVKVVKDLSGAAAAGHANKGAKGRFVRDLVSSDAGISSADGLINWASGAGWKMAASDVRGEVLLSVD
jgi:cytoplasmic iron level regulating protein YaaA (DUF328/UPF0246 family)